MVLPTDLMQIPPKVLPSAYMTIATLPQPWSHVRENRCLNICLRIHVVFSRSAALRCLILHLLEHTPRRYHTSQPNMSSTEGFTRRANVVPPYRRGMRVSKEMLGFYTEVARRHFNTPNKSRTNKCFRQYTTGAMPCLPHIRSRLEFSARQILSYIAKA
jgi:hypothetical protein